MDILTFLIFSYLLFTRRIDFLVFLGSQWQISALEGIKLIEESLKKLSDR